MLDPKFTGLDNYGCPKSDYLLKLAEMTDEELKSECYSMVYQSARCANNPRADWHWQVDACHAEASKRSPGAPLYTAAYEECYRDHGA